jgi:hypothetical protein
MENQILNSNCFSRSEKSEIFSKSSHKTQDFMDLKNLGKTQVIEIQITERRGAE